MPRISRTALAAAAVAAAGLVAGAGAEGAILAGGSPSGTAAQQTHPRVKPATGSRRTVFTLGFTLRVAPGHQGGLTSAYRVAVSAAGCPPPQPAAVRSGPSGATVELRLPAPRSGWCTGRHTVSVFLQRGPYCPPPAAGQPPRACPEFALADLAVGTTHFTVRP